jgi:2-oxoglutarate ferredoxin oxidoreductase subunit beta
LASLQIAPEDTMLISGIGCSSRFPGYTNVYGFNSIHGRAIPIATGAKEANPEKTVLVVGGDGDGYSIGGGHLPHAARKNINITYIVMNNNIYGLTKGQCSPTTPKGDWTKTTTYGNIDTPVNPIHYNLAYGASFIARGFSSNIKHLSALIAEAIAHPGFAIVDVISPCVTFRGDDQFDKLKPLMRIIGEDIEHDPTDKVAAYQLAMEQEEGLIPIGVYYKEIRPTYSDGTAEIKKKAQAAGKNTLEDIYEQFKY